jgi:hypothetical protein
MGKDMRKNLYAICTTAFCCFVFLNVSGEGEVSLKSEEISSDEAVTPLEKQKNLLADYADKIGIGPLLSLKKLTDKSLIVTSESLDSAKRNPDTALLRLDMYEGSNLAILISQSLDYIFDATDSSLAELLTQITDNKELNLAITHLRSSLTELAGYNHIDLENKEYSDSYTRVLTLFSDVIHIIEQDRRFADRGDYFVDFLKLSEKFIRLVFVRHNTEKMLSKIRASLEGIQSVTASTSAALSVDIPLPVPGLKVNLDAFASGSSYGSSGLSFYTVTKTKGAKAGITFSILPAKISGKVSLEQAASSLFYSLEAYMDFLNSSSSPSLNKLQSQMQGMKGAMQDRKDMQQKEKEALANNGMFERYLKLFRAMPPTGVSLIWIDITKAKSTDKAKETTVGAEIGANVTIPLSSLGITLKATSGIKKYTKESPMLSMINEDCTMVDGFDLEDLMKVIGAKNDQSETISDSNLLLGILNTYTFALERLAVSSSPDEIKAYEEKKHSSEKLLSPKTLFGSSGRAGALKASILTAAVLRKKAPNSPEQERRFKKIYEQLHKLSQLGEFSKNNSGIRKKLGYGEKASADIGVKAEINNLQAAFTAQAPYLGNISATVTRKTVEGSPLLQENGKYVTLKFSLPIGEAGVVGMGVLREKFKSVFATPSIPVNLGDLKEISKAFGSSTLNVGGTFAGKALTAIGSPVGVTFYGSSDFTFVWRYVGSLVDVSSHIPLPGQTEIIENKGGRWTLDFITVTTSMNAGINTSSSLLAALPISLKLNASSGKLAKRTGSDTFHDLFSKVNALSLGKADSKSVESTAINSLLSGQSGQLLKIFKGIGSSNSNASFELQELYNELMNSISSESDKRKCTKLFGDFMTACNKLNASIADAGENNAESGESEVAELTGTADGARSSTDDKSSKKGENYLNEEQFKTAFELFKNIADMQYIHVFKPHYDKAFAQAEKM